MKQWSERATLLAVVVSGLLWSVGGCGGETDEKTENTEAAPASSADGGMGGASAARSGGAGGSSTAANSGGSSGGSAPTNTAANSGDSGSSTSAGVPAGEATFTAIYKEILTKGATGNCMFAACHGGAPDPAVNGGLQIKAGDQAGAYKNLVNAKSTGMVCSDKTYVIPGDSAGSLLIQKFADAPPCGAKMPIGPALTAAQVAQIAKWIDDGAKDN